MHDTVASAKQQEIPNFGEKDIRYDDFATKFYIFLFKSFICKQIWFILSKSVTANSIMNNQ